MHCRRGDDSVACRVDAGAGTFPEAGVDGVGAAAIFGGNLRVFSACGGICEVGGGVTAFGRTSDVARVFPGGEFAVVEAVFVAHRGVEEVVLDHAIVDEGVDVGGVVSERMN